VHCNQVLHGSRSDVVWLQRDFGLYLVNVFDTGEAARVLNYPSYGLAHLLDTFCKVKAQKQFQVPVVLVRCVKAHTWFENCAVLFS
jgi:ribonuclease D